MILQSSSLVPSGCEVYTPPALARAIVKAMVPFCPDTWLEPSYGGGVFLSALNDEGVEPGKIVAIDLSAVARPDVEVLATCYPGTEGLGWLRKSRASFDAIIGNPPYVAISELSPDLKRAALGCRNPATGELFGAKANLWVVFVAECLQRLARGGSIGFVLPASWDYADYSAEFRRWLPQQFEYFASLRSARPLFDGVSEGAVVVVAGGFGRKNVRSVRVECGDREDIVVALHSIAKGLDAFGDEAITVESSPVSGRLGDYARITLGGVTGDARYFVMTESRRRELDLPRLACLPVVSKARHLAWPFIGVEEWRALWAADEPVWLFRPPAGMIDDPAVRRYLKLPTVRGGCDRTRYKIRSREPWFETPLPKRVGAILTGVSTARPRLVFPRMRRLTATNTLYVVQFAPQVTAPQKLAVAAAFSSEMVTAQIEKVQRRYAGGLRKLEPGDLLDLRLPDLDATVTEGDYSRLFADCRAQPAS